MILQVVLLLSVFANTNAFWYNVAPQGHTLVFSRHGRHYDVADSGVTVFPFTTAHKVKTAEDIDKRQGLTCTSIEGTPITYKEILIGNMIDPSKVLNTIQLFGLNYDQTKIIDVVEQHLQEICREFKYTELEISQSSRVQVLLKEKLQADQTHQDTGVTITFVRMSNAKIPEPLLSERQRLNEELSKQLREKAETETQRLQKIKLAQAQTADSERALNVTLANIEQERLLSTRELERALEETRNNALKITILAAAKSAENTLFEAHIRNMYSIPGYPITAQLEAIYGNTSKIYMGGNGNNNPLLLVDQVQSLFSSSNNNGPVSSLFSSSNNNREVSGG